MTLAARSRMDDPARPEFWTVRRRFAPAHGIPREPGKRRIDLADVVGDDMTWSWRHGETLRCQ